MNRKNLYLYTNERTNPIQSFYELLLTKLILVYEIEPFTENDKLHICPKDKALYLKSRGSPYSFSLRVSPDV